MEWGGEGVLGGVWVGRGVIHSPAGIHVAACVLQLPFALVLHRNPMSKHWTFGCFCNIGNVAPCWMEGGGVCGGVGYILPPAYILFLLFVFVD